MGDHSALGNATSPGIIRADIRADGWEVAPHERDRQRTPTSPLHREPLNCWCSDVCRAATQYFCRPISCRTMVTGWLAHHALVTRSD